MKYNIELDKLFCYMRQDAMTDFTKNVTSPRALDYIAKKLSFKYLITTAVIENKYTYKSTLKWICTESMKQKNGYLLYRLKEDSKLSKTWKNKIEQFIKGCRE